MKIKSSGISRALKKGALKIRKAAPNILLGAGVVGVIAGTVLACISTTKTSDIMAEHEEQLKVAEAEPDGITKVRQTYFNTIFKFAKLYLPAAGCIALGFTMIFGSHSILQSRNAMLSAELLGVTQAFNAYRDKVRDKLGADVDGELMHEDKREEIDGQMCVFEDESLSAVEGNYIKHMNRETSTKWVANSMDMNRFIVERVEKIAQTNFEAHGFLLLNDVLDALGMAKTRQGCTHGWVVESGKVKVIEFRPTFIYGTYNNEGRSASKDDGCVRLDFNCDGYILDRIDLEDK